MLFRTVMSSVALAACLTLAPAAHADGTIDPPPPPGGGGGTGVTDGCTDSPECPTAVLAMLGTAGVGLGLHLRNYLQARNMNKTAAAEA